MERFIGPATWQYEPDAYAQTILEPVEDLLSRASKKWRPVFAILLLDAFGCDSSVYERLFCLMLELVHTGALIIDDIEDESELRRGDVSIHRRYGTDIAINAANFLYFAPLLELHQHQHLDDAQKLRINELTTHYYLRGHLGQAADIWRSRFLDHTNISEWLAEADDGRILQTYADKTAAAIQAAVDFAAIVTRLKDETVLQDLKQFTRSVGVAFQIIDDVNNFSDSSDWTKTVGEDLATGKMTYVIWSVLRDLPADQSKHLRDLLIDPRRRVDPDELRAGIDLVRESGTLDRCRREAYEMFDRGWVLFCQHVPESQSRDCIQRLCMRIYGGLASV